MQTRPPDDQIIDQPFLQNFLIRTVRQEYQALFTVTAIIHRFLRTSMG